MVVGWVDSGGWRAVCVCVVRTRAAYANGGQRQACGCGADGRDAGRVDRVWRRAVWGDADRLDDGRVVSGWQHGVGCVAVRLFAAWVGARQQGSGWVGFGLSGAGQPNGSSRFAG